MGEDQRHMGRRHSVWGNLAWIEWRRSFSWKGQGGGAGNRDFLWLALLLLLTFVLALFLLGVHDGLLVQLMNVSFGYVERHGTPIWALSKVSPDNPGFDEGLISRIEELESPKLNTFVFTQVGGTIRFPSSRLRSGVEIWKDQRFAAVGRAVTNEDPLFQASFRQAGLSPVSEDGSLPLEVVLNRSLFRRYFDCAEYVSVLGERLPWLEPGTDDGGKLDCLKENKIWLEVRVGRDMELHQFRVLWLDHISSIERVAFLVPIRILAALQLVAANGKLKYYPEFGGEVGGRIEAVRFWGDLDFEVAGKLMNCLDVKSRVSRSGRVKFDKPKPIAQVAGCAKWLGLSFDGAEPGVSTRGLRRASVTIDRKYELKAGESFRFNDGTFEVRCDLLSPRWQTRVECEGDGAVFLSWREIIGKFSSATIYTKKRFALLETVERLESLRLEGCSTDALGCEAIYVHGLYQDALMRFDFIGRIFDILARYLNIFFVFFLLGLLGIQVGMVILHRRHNYAVLLARGLAFNEVLAMVMAQIGMSVGVAFTAALYSISVLRDCLGRGLVSILEDEKFGGQISRQLDLMPLSFGDYCFTGVVTLLLAWLISWVLLYRLCPGRKGEPCEILYS